MLHHRFVDFYVGPAVLLLGRETVGVTAFIDEAMERGLYTWSGFLDVGSNDAGLRFRVIEALCPLLALPGRDPREIDVVFTSSQGIGFIGNGSSPLQIQQF